MNRVRFVAVAVVVAATIPAGAALGGHPDPGPQNTCALNGHRPESAAKGRAPAVETTTTPPSVRDGAYVWADPADTIGTAANMGYTELDMARKDAGGRPSPSWEQASANNNFQVFLAREGSCVFIANNHVKIPGVPLP